MRRIVDVLLVLVVIAGAVWTYQVKHETELATKAANDLTTRIAAQERKIALLEADWAIETSPPRLSIVAEKFADELKLRDLESTQIITADELPEFMVIEEASEPVETLQAREGIDTFSTGSIDALIEKAKPAQ